MIFAIFLSDEKKLVDIHSSIAGYLKKITENHRYHSFQRQLSSGEKITSAL
jgi:hypothetical protein